MDRILIEGCTRILLRAELDEGGCWAWPGAKTPDGYGQIMLRSRTTARVHRVTYAVLVSEIPEGLVIDHLCRNRACVNPAHLEAVTLQENIARGEGDAVRKKNQTHCIHGHEFTPENTRKVRSGRQCRTCQKNYNREYFRKYRNIRKAERAV